MQKKELKFILQEGEGLKIEFKESLKNLDKEMAAFANSEGGRIFLGISDDNKLKGIKITNKLKSQIQDIARNCDPHVKIILEEIGNVLIINVKEGIDKPYKCSSGFYLRQGPNSQKLTRDEIINFSIGEGKIKFDEQFNTKFDFKKDFDNNKLIDYLRRAKISKIMPTEKILLELDAAEKNKKLNFNNAGMLFFAKNPQFFISHSVFTCVLFRDKEGSDIIDRQEIEGNLIQIVESVMKFVEKNTRVAYRFTGKPQRENVYEYPLEAIREAVVNSVTHRDYFESGHNNILRIFPNKLTITNVWIKPLWFKLGRDTFRRNKIIANLFTRIGWIEKVGSGFARMKNYCREVRAPIFKLDADKKYFRIVFFKSEDYLKLAEKGVEMGVERGVERGVETPSEKQQIIIALIKTNPRISKEQLRKQGKLTKKTVEYNISKLKQKGFLKRIGPAKGGYWKVKK